MKRGLRNAATLSATLVAMMLADTGAGAQTFSPQELAGKLSGTWILDRELSTGLRAPDQRGGGAYAPRPLFAMAAAAPQRGGGGRGGGFSDASDLTPEQRGAQAAMRQLQQIAQQITITASVESVTFTDARGDRTFTVNDKSSKIDVGGSIVSVKSKWDRHVLKQEFSNTQAKLVETWGLDDAGHLVLTAKVESLTLMTPEMKAVFNRQ